MPRSRERRPQGRRPLSRASWTRRPRENRGTAPARRPRFDEVDAASPRRPRSSGLLGRLGRDGVDGLVHPIVSTDDRDPERYIVYLEQAGIGLPDESYYREDAHEADVRAAYLGPPRGDARARRPCPSRPQPPPGSCRSRPGSPAGHWDKVTNRDPVKTYTKVDRAALAELTPGVDWAGVPRRDGGRRPARSTPTIARQPRFLTAMAAALCRRPGRLLAGLAALAGRPRATLRTSVRARRGELRLLRPDPLRRPRDARAVEARGRRSSRRPSARRSAGSTSRGTSRRTPRSGWSSSSTTSSRRSGATSPRWPGWASETRAEALAKLEAFTPKIGYPDALARLLDPRHRPRRPRRQRPPGRRHSRSTATSPSSAARSTGPSGS